MTTLVGGLKPGPADGGPGMAQFNGPVALASPDDRVLFVAEAAGQRIRRVITSSGLVSTLQTFSSLVPAGLAFGPGLSSLLVSDSATCRIFRLELTAGCDGELFSGAELDSCGVCAGKDACVDCRRVASLRILATPPHTHT